MQQMLLPILMFAALGAMMFYGMRKQKRVAAATREMHDSLVPGARVMTTSGLHATITAVADDTIELEIAPGLRTTWIKRSGPRGRRAGTDGVRRLGDHRRCRGTARRQHRRIDYGKDRKSNDLN